MCETVGLTFLITAAVCVLCMGHSHPGGHRTPPPLDGTNKFHDSKLVQDADHIKEHLQDVVGVKEEEMSAEELEFHYFKLHDTDNNTKLDGLEILAALTHMMPSEDILEPITDEEREGKTAEQLAQLEETRRNHVMEYYTGIIDQVLKEDDYDQDGYLTYVEYVLARRRDEERYRKQQEEEDMKNNKKDEH